MPRGIPTLNAEQKKTVLERIKEKGERVPDLAKEYGINPNIIYRILGNQTQGESLHLELAKLKRENEALLKIIGQLVAANEAGKKMRYGKGN
jgi:transposase-like protein